MYFVVVPPRNNIKHASLIKYSRRKNIHLLSHAYPDDLPSLNLHSSINNSINVSLRVYITNLLHVCVYYIYILCYLFYLNDSRTILYKSIYSNHQRAEYIN